MRGRVCGVAADGQIMTGILELQNLSKSFGPTHVIHDVTLSVNSGERHAIIGPNGAGKSTLFNLISGLHPASSGKVILKGRDVTGLPPHAIAKRGLSRSFQVTNIMPNLSVFENLRCATLRQFGSGLNFWRGIHRVAGLAERSEEVLALVGLSERGDDAAGVLSHADQRMLELAITIASGADVILLDEPTAGMSREETARAINTIRRVTRERTLIIVEHDMGVVFELSDRISVLEHGRIIATGPPSDIRANSAVQDAYLGHVSTT